MMQMHQEASDSQAAGQAAPSIILGRDNAWVINGRLPLQLHCCSIRIQKPHQTEIALQAEPPDTMRAFLKVFNWTLPTNAFHNDD